MKMNLKNFMILIFVYFSFLLIGTVCFILSFWTNIFSSFDVLFFRCLILLIIVCLIMAILLLFAMKKSNILKDIITYRDILLICTFFFFLNYFFYGIPFNVSRSNSIILVSFLYEHKGSPKTEEEITSFVINKYFYEYKAVSIRLREQITAGNIQKVGNGYILTKRGEKIVETLGFITDLYNIKNNFLKDGHRLPHNGSSFYK